MFMADLIIKWFLKSPACFRSHTKYETILIEVCLLLNKYDEKNHCCIIKGSVFKKNKYLKAILPFQITQSISGIAFEHEALVICSAFSMLINVNTPRHPILD